MKLFTTLLSIAGLSYASAGRFATSPITKRIDESSLTAVTSIPRGGGLTIMSPDVAAKTFIYLNGVNGALCFLAPKFAIEKGYGAKVCGDAEAWITRTLGAVSLNASLLFYLQQVKGMAFGKAIGISVLPYLLNEIYRLASPNVDKVVGLPKSSHYPGTLFNVAVLMASVLDVDWAPKLYFVYGLFSIISGVHVYLAPDNFRSTLGINAPGPLAKLLMKTMGYFLWVHYIAVCVVDSLPKQIGYAAFAQGAGILGSLVLGEYAPVSTPKSVFWLILLLVIGASLV